MKVRYLKASALEDLRENVKANLDTYRSGSFSFLLADAAIFFEGGVEFNEKSLGQLNPPKGENLLEEENCAICYGALSGLSPYEARDERLWAYLAHTYLLEYARARWPIPSDDQLAEEHVKTHFFAKDKRQVERDNVGSRLWWMARLCHRVQGLTPSESLKVLLFKSDVRANIIERPTVSQSAELFSALIKRLHLSYLHEKKLFDRNKFRSLMIRLNSIGGVRLLDSMTEHQLATMLDDVIRNDLGLQTI